MKLIISKLISSGLLAMSAALFLPLASCSDDDDMTNDVPGTSTLEVSNSNETFNFRYNDENTQTLSFSTNQCWRIAVDDESLAWVRFSKISGNAGDNQVSIIVEPLTDDAPDARATSFRLIAGDKEQSFKILQSQKDAIVILDPENYTNLVYNEQNLKVDFVTNVDEYTVEITYDTPDVGNWISVVESRASHQDAVNLHIAANLVKTSRKATLSIKSTDVIVTAEISQEGKPDPMVQITNKNDFSGTLDKNGGEYTVTYRTVEIPDLQIATVLNPEGNWASVNTSEEGKIKVTIQPNTGRAARTVTITLSSKANPALIDNVVLTQDLDRSISVDANHSLQSEITGMGLTTADFTEIEIRGELSTADWNLLKKMATSENLKSIDLTNVTNTSLPKSAFMNCSKLQQLILPQNGQIKEIPMELCRNVAGLKTVSIPEGVQTIDRHAFAACAGIETLYLPSTLTFMYGYCFEKLTALKEIHVKSKPVQIFDVPRGTDSKNVKAMVFNDTDKGRPKTCTLYVPAAYEELYKKSALTLDDLGLTEWPEFDSWKATSGSFRWTNADTNVIVEE